MPEVGQINIEPLVASKATPKPQAAAEQAARVVISRIQDAGGDSAKALEALAGSTDEIHEALVETSNADSEDLSMTETPAVAIIPDSEDSTLPEDQEYADNCDAVMAVGGDYANSAYSTDLDSQQEKLDILAKSWQSLDLRFDRPNLGMTLFIIRYMNRVATAPRQGSAGKFFDEFEAQRRDIINNNFDQLKKVYLELETADDSLPSEIYVTFLDHIMQSPSEDAIRESEFCLEHFDTGPMANRLALLHKILGDQELGRNFTGEEADRSAVLRLVLEKTTQLIDTEPSEITRGDKKDLIHALALVSLNLGPWHIGHKTREYFDGKIKEWGLDKRSLFEAWGKTATSKDEDNKPGISTEDFIANNIATMFALEKVRPGICKTLFDEFGIADFERYPEEALVAQYDNRDKDMPYGVSIDAREDHNGALGSDNDRIRRKLYADLAALGYGLRIYEADGRDVLKSLHAATKRYGDKNKISFALIHQHGSEDAIGEGSGQAVTKTHVRRALEHADNRRVREVRDYFVENPTLILASCSTAPIGEIFKEFGFNVIAPQIPTALRKLDVAQSDTPGELKFAGEYSNKDAAVHFANPHAK